jgi:hypothetical protein
MAVLLVSTALFTSFVFVPTIAPYEIVNVEVSPIPEKEFVEEEPEYVPTLEDLWVMEKDLPKIMEAEVINRDLPSNWSGRKIYFKYTYIGEYTESTQTVLDDLLLDEYKWQKQLDEEGNVVMGGIVLAKDGTFQLHTHNTFTKGERFFLLGDLLDRYHNNEELIGTKIRFGTVTLESIWERDTRILQDNLVPYADLVISTCLERYGDRRLISGWNMVSENI